MSDPPTPGFLDSSFVVRYLTNDPPDQAAVAARLIDSTTAVVLSELVLVETGYVLETVYGVPRPKVVDALTALIRRKNVRLLHLSQELALAGLRQCRDSRRVSYVDALLWAEAHHAGAQHIYTFDRRFPTDGLTVGADN